MTRVFAVTMVAATLAAAPALAQTPDGWREMAASARAAADAARAGVDEWQAQAGQAAARAREEAERDRETERRDRDKDRETSLFDQGTSAMDSNRWDRAVESFTRVAEMKGSRADGALYWKAYSQDRLGQRAEALTTIAELTKTYPQSRYVKQAQALEMDVRRRVGQPVSPEAQGDEDLKLMALNALLNTDPEKAVPTLEKMLSGPTSPKVRDRAVFVLAQSNSPRARQVLRDLAKGSSTPELQSKAIQYLGVMGNSESRAVLAEVYSSTTDVDVKRRILRAFMVSGEKQRLLTAAQTEQNADLRAEAVRQLGAMGANDELWQMYQKESSTAVKKQILQAMFVGGNSTRMIELARSEKDPELRAVAVRNLGLMGGANSGTALVEIYGADKDPAIRRSVINALFLQSNASALVDLARKESDPEMKKSIVQKLSLMQNKVATDYMLELLGK